MRITLKAARVNAGLRQIDAAQYLGVNLDKIKYLEKPEGSERISLKDFLALCDLYGCTIDDIILPYKSPKSEAEASGNSTDQVIDCAI